MIWPRQSHFISVFVGITEAVLQDVHLDLIPRARLMAVPVGPGKGKVAVAPDDARLLEVLRTSVTPDVSAKEEEIREHARSSLESAMRTADEAEGLFSIAGVMRRIADHYVLPIVRVKRAVLEVTPRLTRDIPNGNVQAPRGFIDAVIECLLADASNELAREQPGEVTMWATRDYQALLRLAASHFLDRVAVSAGSPNAVGRLMDLMNAISVLPYEGSPARGRIVLAAGREHPSLRRTVVFRDGVALGEPKAARKALQIVSDRGLLWCSDEVVIGVAEKAAEYERTREDLFEVHFAGAARWQLWHADRALLEVEHGTPRIPRPRIDEAGFGQRVRARLPDADVAALWQIVKTAQDQRHGTMVVVSARAATEAERMAPQLVRIDPEPLTNMDVIMQLSEIDGALLLDQKGHCHAFGVILDGTAQPNRGTFSRGARHNSAIRYTDSDANAVAVVVSEDGDVTVFPQEEA